jgi:hypothetical protein
VKKPDKPKHEKFNELAKAWDPEFGPSPETMAELKKTLVFNHAMAGLLKACLVNEPHRPVVLKPHERN